eukprot:TRINITY_DN7128_c0_g1_i1.p3 TRINITY_DN7128_c0_g1~~TRINITY_DN7128_c0_g1_i1.p3  ORF type:complete len:300 (+),score=118.32 TRINITY_DN7128_c0_g1_i1:50-949(+)
MNVEQAAQALALRDKKVVKKAKKLVQKLGFQHSGTQLPCDMAKEAACLFLAARMVGCEVEVARVARCGATTERELCRTATVVQNLLQLRLPSVDLRVLCAKYGKRDTDEDATGAVAPIPRPGYLFSEVRDAIRTLHERLPGARLCDAHLCAVFQLVWAREAPPAHAAAVTEKVMAATSATDIARYRDTIAMVTSVLPELTPEKKEKEPKAAATPQPPVNRPVPFTSPAPSGSPGLSDATSDDDGASRKRRATDDGSDGDGAPPAKRAKPIELTPVAPVPPAPKQLTLTGFARGGAVDRE